MPSVAAVFAAVTALFFKVVFEQLGVLPQSGMPSVTMTRSIINYLNMFTGKNLTASVIMRKELACRLLRAEENANKLPVKMVIPLGAFIFPVILLSMMLPVVIRFLEVMGKGG